MNAKCRRSLSSFPTLPWEEGALAPGDLRPHHRAALRQAPQGLREKLNELVAGTRYADMSLEQVIARDRGRQGRARRSSTTPRRPGTTRSSGIAWRRGGGEALGRARAAHRRRLRRPTTHSRRQFEKTAVERFGSGWAWLVDARRQARDRLDLERGHADHHGRDAAPHARRLGARVLRRLREPPARVREGGDRQAAQLGFRREQLDNPEGSARPRERQSRRGLAECRTSMSHRRLHRPPRRSPPGSSPAARWSSSWWWWAASRASRTRGCRSSSGSRSSGSLPPTERGAVGGDLRQVPARRPSSRSATTT